MFGRLNGNLVLGAFLLLTGCVQGPQNSDHQSLSRGANADDIVRFSSTCEAWDDWDKPTEPFRIFGNAYYVGTCGIAAIFIPGQGEHILIDSGTEAGAEIVLANIRKLGFDPRDIRFIGTSHEHFDHVGGLAKLTEVTGAKVGTSDQALQVLLTGFSDSGDPQYGMHEAMAPIADAGLWNAPEHADTLAGTGLKAIPTPGHTPGALTWHWQTCYGSLCKYIVYADSLSPVSSDEYRFSDHPEYLAKYRESIKVVRGLDCDILLTPHPSASRMIERAATGTLEGGMTCADYADAISARLDARLAEEAEGQ